MKTRPYEPDLHGDGRGRMVSMEVEPPMGELITIWGDGQPLSTWRLDGAPWSLLLLRGENETAVGWTFAPKPPVKPEPVKSYAEYLDGDDFYFSRSTGCVHGVISAGSPAPWVLALRDFLNDYYPAQDALDGEGG